MTGTISQEKQQLFASAITNGDVIVRTPTSDDSDLNPTAPSYSNQEALINGIWMIRNGISLSEASQLFNKCSLATVWGFKKVATDFNNWNIEQEPSDLTLTELNEELTNKNEFIKQLEKQLKNLMAILASAKEQDPALMNRVTLQYINDSRRETVDSAKEEARLKAEKEAEEQALLVRQMLNF